MRVLGTYAVILGVVRMVLLYAGVAFAALCAVDWAVRTRRISPFNRVARFFRGNVDPLLAPIERTVVRAGGLPSSAAWWALVAFVVFGILLISLLQFAGDVLFQIIAASQAPQEAWRLVVSWTISILILALFVRVIASWLPVSPYSKWIRWSFVLTDWMIRPLQRFVPRVGMLDITPIVAWLLLSAVRYVILG